jgi:hypothetical protein
MILSAACFDKGAASAPAAASRDRDAKMPSRIRNSFTVK